MADFTYKIGGLDINPGLMKFEETDPCRSRHKFIVRLKGDVLAIYFCETTRHRFVAARFGIYQDDPDILGGGSIYTDTEDRLTLNDYSAQYGGVPKIVAAEFGKLVRPEIENLHLKVVDLVANPINMSGKWLELGFTE